jgi:hypothetical protein
MLVSLLRDVMSYPQGIAKSYPRVEHLLRLSLAHLSVRFWRTFTKRSKGGEFFSLVSALSRGPRPCQDVLWRTRSVEDPIANFWPDWRESGTKGILS